MSAPRDTHDNNPTSDANEDLRRLRAERDRFLAFAFCGNDLILELDAEGRVAFAAGAADDLLGCAAEDLVGRPFLSLVALPDRRAACALLMRAAGGQRFQDQPTAFAGEGRPARAALLTGFALPQLERRTFLALRRPAPAAKPDGAPDIASSVAQVAAARRMIADRAFQVAYQPVFLLDDRNEHHLEALLRPPPDAFPGLGTAEVVAQCEANGLIPDLDLAMFRMVIDQLYHASANGMPYPAAVNISGLSLVDDRFRRELDALLQPRRALPTWLIVEINGVDKIDDLPLVNEFVQNLRCRGYRVGIGDFGAMGAAFEHLVMLDVDLVKIDSRMLRNPEHVGKRRALVRAINALCGALKVMTVATHIEEADTLSALVDLGVRLGQGHALAEPMLDVDMLSAKSMREIRWRRRTAQEVEAA
jgi:EAL domain-containing protein (putative c-di-GMP-specific phosphodiesterase class I)